VSDDDSLYLQQTYRKVFTGLGTMQGECTIKLRPNDTPHAIHVAYNVPIPLREQVQAELNRMESWEYLSS